MGQCISPTHYICNTASLWTAFDVDKDTGTLKPKANTTEHHVPNQCSEGTWSEDYKNSSLSTYRSFLQTYLEPLICQSILRNSKRGFGIFHGSMVCTKLITTLNAA